MKQKARVGTLCGLGGTKFKKWGDPIKYPKTPTLLISGNNLPTL